MIHARAGQATPPPESGTARLLADRTLLAAKLSEEAAELAAAETAAEAVGDGWRTIATAAQPTDDALLALAASLCEKPDPK